MDYLITILILNWIMISAVVFRNTGSLKWFIRIPTAIFAPLGGLIAVIVVSLFILTGQKEIK